MATVETKVVNNALVYYDSRYTNRWLDAIGENVRKYIALAGMPCDDSTTNVTAWTVTETDNGAGNTSVTASQTAGNCMLITTAQNEYDGVSMQLNGEGFDFAAGTQLYFGIRCAASDATQTDFLVGLAEIDTTLTAADTTHALGVGGDGAFFFKLDDSTTITAYGYNGGASANSSALSSVMNTGYHTYEVFFDGTTIYWYYDGTLITSAASTNITAALTPSISFRAGSGAAYTLEVSWIRCIQVR